MMKSRLRLSLTLQMAKSSHSLVLVTNLVTYLSVLTKPLKLTVTGVHHETNHRLCPALEYDIYDSTAYMVKDVPYNFPGTNTPVYNWDRAMAILHYKLPFNNLRNVQL